MKGKLSETKSKDVVEIAMSDLFDHVKNLENKLKEIETMTNDICAKIMISHSLLVVRKVSEDKVKDLKKILD